MRDIEEEDFDFKSGDSLLKRGSLIFDNSDLSFDSPINDLKWWKWRENAYWREPYGPGSSISDLMDHPVVHISWYDANAYAKWVKKDYLLNQNGSGQPEAVIEMQHILGVMSQSILNLYLQITGRGTFHI